MVRAGNHSGAFGDRERDDENDFSPPSMPRFHQKDLTGFGQALLTAAGTPDDLAVVVATSLIKADLCGIESHGLMRLPRYIGRIRDGTMQPGARPVVAQRHGANAVVDGGGVSGRSRRTSARNSRGKYARNMARPAWR